MAGDNGSEAGKYTPSQLRYMAARTSRLGMSAGAARNQLVQSLLKYFVVRMALKCLRCGEPLTDDCKVHIDHIESWFTAADPRTSYFDLGNVGFSHASCNQGFSGIWQCRKRKL